MSRLRPAGLAAAGPLARLAVVAVQLRRRLREKRRRAAGMDRFDIVSGADQDRPLPNGVLSPAQYRSLIGASVRLTECGDLQAAETGELFTRVR